MDQTPIADMKFETAVAELEDIVSSMEGGKLELEASIAAYKRGMELMKHCQAQLADARDDPGYMSPLDMVFRELETGERYVRRGGASVAPDRRTCSRGGGAIPIRPAGL